MKEEITMKKTRKTSKKGFTLVELIVVLVILAILAAMLVPALTGYIRRARQEKEFQAASTVLTAVQVEVTSAYGEGKTIDGNYVTLDKLEELTGVALKSVTFTVNVPAAGGEELTGVNAYTVSAITVSFDGKNYYHYTSGDGSWTANTTAGSESITAGRASSGNSGNTGN